MLHVQAATVELELGELEFVGHAIHVVAIVAPTVVEYVPVPQLLQVALPVAVLYFPVTQEVQTPPSGPVDPVLHVQAAGAELEIGELEPAGHATHVAAAVAPVVVKYVPVAQSVQAAEPVAILYLPATQAVHVPPSGPVYPALQAGLIQAALDVLAMGELVPAGHVSHTPPSLHPVICTSASCKGSPDEIEM
jgi:hypothetical protein